MPSIYKLDVMHDTVQARCVTFDLDDHGRIPDNLAALTMTVIALHKANGDLGWIGDMISEAEEKPDYSFADREVE